MQEMPGNKKKKLSRLRKKKNIILIQRKLANLLFKKNYWNFMGRDLTNFKPLKILEGDQ